MQYFLKGFLHFNCNYLTELIVTSLDTSSGVDFSRMFEGCTYWFEIYRLNEENLEKIIEHVKNLEQSFYNLEEGIKKNFFENLKETGNQNDLNIQ